MGRCGVAGRAAAQRDDLQAATMNDLVATLQGEGALAPEQEDNLVGYIDALPKGYPFFQGIDMEEGVPEEQLREIIVYVKDLNPKLYLLQELTGDL
jgi:hypothetical protein